MKLIITALAALLAGCSSITGTPVAEPPPAISMEEQAATATKHNLQQWLDNEPITAPLKLTVTRVNVIHVMGNQYKGMVTIKTFKGTTRDIPIEIVADNENYIWESDKGVFTWTLDDGYPPGTPDNPTPLPAFDGWANLTTKAGKSKCQMTVDAVECQVEFSPQRYVGGFPVSGFRFDGSLEWLDGSLSGDFNQIDYGFYRTMTWTIDATAAGTRFTHENGSTVFVSTSGITTG